jgi:2-polyprenyl-3-methyl-5-hydroxy-6-metoxy-1,4-benzoquinol methylase
MKGLNGIMGSLAVLTRKYSKFEVQTKGHRANLMTDFPFEKYSTVVDVGGGIGAFSLPLARMHKNVKITIHDLPEALVQARHVSRQNSLFVAS